MNRFSSFFRSVRVSILVTALGANSPIVFAAPDRISDTKLFKAMLEHTSTREQLIKTMETGGVSTEAMSLIEPDLKKRMGKEKAPKFKVIKNQLSVNGKKVPVYFDSYEPLILRVRGEKWKYNEEKAGEENYFKLTKLLEGSSSNAFSPLELLVPPAHATGDPNYVLPGIAVGCLAGVVIAKCTGNTGGKKMALAALLGGFVGGIGGLMAESSKNAAGGSSSLATSAAKTAPVENTITTIPEPDDGTDAAQ